MLIIFIITEDEVYKIRVRDPKVLEKIYKEYKSKIYTFLIIKTNGNHDVAEEVLCETFKSIIESAPKIQNAKNFQGWVLQIAFRRLNDFLRKRYKEKKYLETLNEEDFKTEAEPEETDSKEEILLVNLAMNNIKEKYKEVINLKYIEKKSVREIAGKLKTTDAAANSILERARVALKKEFKKVVRDY